MLLSYIELCELVDGGVLTNVDHDLINAASIDLTLGPRGLCEVVLPAGPDEVVLSLSDRTPMMTAEIDFTQGYVLQPGDFILASTEQVFNLPLHISAVYKLKSSMARIGLNSANAGWADAGWNGSVLTLQLKNDSKGHAIEIKAGDRIGQMLFFSHTLVPEDRSYAARGRYNNLKNASGILA